MLGMSRMTTLAQAHAMRWQIGEALHTIQEAERIGPEKIRVHLRRPRCRP
jgi:hypothetical protein